MGWMDNSTIVPVVVEVVEHADTDLLPVPVRRLLHLIASCVADDVVAAVDECVAVSIDYAVPV